jgi:hypothetical protein
MDGFAGFVALGSTLSGTILTRDSDDTPMNGTSAPLFRVYGPDGLMTNGTGTSSLKNTGSVTGATNATPIVITSAAHGLQTGTRVTVASVGGNTAANGDWTITRVGADTFSLDTSVGNGSYTSGGTWSVAGLYGFTVDATAGNGYEAGECYSVLWTATVDSLVRGGTITFCVN